MEKRVRTDRIETSRHVMLSNVRGGLTELERFKKDQYLIRYHKSTTGFDVLLDSGSWIGFRYRDAHWSFVKK